MPRINGSGAVDDQAAYGRRVPAALVDTVACWPVVQIDRALEEALSRRCVMVRNQREVHRLAELVSGAVPALPLPVDPHTGLAHTPQRNHVKPARPKHGHQKGRAAS
jgi:hypothetical protein